MADYRWLPATWTRIVVPFLDSLNAADRLIVEEGLEEIRKNPTGPSTFPWRGNIHGDRPLPRTTRIGLIDMDGNYDRFVQVIFAPHVDFPYLGAVALLGFAEEPVEGNGSEGQD